MKAPPARLNRLLCVLLVNGAVLGVESIAQRCANSSELLFLKKPRIHQTAEGQFGPYAYRSNAAQYFNLLWPVCLGWWYARQRAPGLSAGGLGDGARKHWLLGAAALIAACPIVSSSRTGAITCAAMAVTCIGWPLVATRGRRRATNHRASLRQREMRRLAWGIAWGVGLGLTLGWHQLAPRLAWEQLKNGLAGRAAMDGTARQMARDYPWLGTGPGTFETVSQLYARPEMFWPAQLHNDWLETRVTWGWLGSGLLWAGLGCVLARWFGGRDGIQVPGVFVGFIWLALGGCLAQARFDFPLQVHSVLFLFVLWCAVLGAARREI